MAEHERETAQASASRAGIGALSSRGVEGSRMKTITTVLAVGTATLIGSPAAFADDARPEQVRAYVQGIEAETDANAPEFMPSFAASRAGAAVDLWPAKHNFATTFGAELQLRMARNMFLDLSYSAAFAHVG